MKTKTEKSVVVGITSGIAAFKVTELLNRLKKKGVSVEVILSENAKNMVPLERIRKITDKKIYTNLFDKKFDYEDVLKKRKVDHIDLAYRSNLLIVIPATANVLAKIAHGIADDYLTTVILATQAPIVVCPSMNIHMWENKATQTNVEILKKRGIKIWGPSEGMLACGYTGTGRLIDIDIVEEGILNLLQAKTELSGKQILVTAGGTREPIDAVRFIGNKSSGKMGAALADVCFEKGAEVILLRAKSAVKPKNNIREYSFETASELAELIKKHTPYSDVIFHAAAVSDFGMDEHEGKISSNKKHALTLIPKDKIIAKIRLYNPNILLFGFKAEFKPSKTRIKEVGKEYIKQHGVDALVVNDISQKDRGFEADTNEATVVLSNGEQTFIPLSSKYAVAKKIVEVLTEKFIKT